MEPQPLVERIAVEPDDAIVAALGVEASEAYSGCRAEAHRQLVEELGDPTPYRLG